MPLLHLLDYAVLALLFSFAGFAIEILWRGDGGANRSRALAALGLCDTPLMPMYGAGAALVVAALLGTRARGWSAPERIALVSAAVVLFEWVGGHTWRWLSGGEDGWLYDNGCYVDALHSLGWLVLVVVADTVLGAAAIPCLSGAGQT